MQDRILKIRSLAALGSDFRGFPQGDGKVTPKVTFLTPKVTFLPLKVAFLGGQKSCEPSRELQESLGPSGPEIPKKSEKSLPGPPALGSQKVWKKSRKVPNRHCRDFFQTFRTFSRLFRAPGPEAPKDLFPDFLGISGPEGPRDSCSSREGSQQKSLLGSLSRHLGGSPGSHFSSNF